jgi:hypothetical protein
MATRLTVRWGPRFTTAMDGLRRAEWLAGRPGESTDEFDTLSYHLTVALEDAPVGLVRTTVGPPSVLQAWSGGRAPVPHGPAVAELTRGVVAASARQLGVYSLAMLETLLRLRALGVTVAVGAVEPDFVGRHFLADVGFQKVGAPIAFDDRPRRGTIAQCLSLAIDEERETSWSAKRWALLRRLDERGYRVDSDLATVLAEVGAGASQ